MNTPALSKHERILAKAERKATKEREVAQLTRPELVAEANRLLHGFGSDLQTQMHPDGRLMVYSTTNGAILFDETPTHELMATGAVIQGPTAHLRSMLVNLPTVFEARLTNIIASSIPNGHSTFVHDAPRVASLLCRAFWMLAEDPSVSQSAMVVAMTTPKTRVWASELMGAAGSMGEESAHYGRQAMTRAPILATLAEDRHATGAEVALGGSPLQIAKAMGAGKRTMELPAAVVSLVHPGNVATLEKWLAELHASAPTELANLNTSRIRVLLSAMLAARQVERYTPEGFPTWYLHQRLLMLSNGIKLEPVQLSVLAPWALVTANQRGGRKPSMSLQTAAGACLTAMGKPPKSSQIEHVELHQGWETKVVGNWVIRAATSSTELAQWGTELKLCLAIPDYNRLYVRNVLAGEVVLIGVLKSHQVDGQKQHHIASVAEIDVRTGEVLQHNTTANQPASRAANQVLAIAIEEQGAAK